LVLGVFLSRSWSAVAAEEARPTPSHGHYDRCEWERAQGILACGWELDRCLAENSRPLEPLMCYLLHDMCLDFVEQRYELCMGPLPLAET